MVGGVTFSHGSAGSVEVPGPQATSAPRRLPRFAAERTEGGVLYSHRRHSADVTVWDLELDAMTPAQFSALDAFHTAVGPGADFTYTHTDGSSYAARFVSTDLNRVRGGGLNKVSLVIEVNGGVS